YQNGELIGQTPLENLAAGTYEVQYTSTATCSSSTTVELTASDLIIVVANIMPDNCAGNAGSIELAVAGEVNDYTYTWSDDVSDTNIANNLAAGNYGVTVIDANGCTAEFANITVEKDCNVTCSLEGRATITPTVCGQMNGRIALEVTGATGDLTYTWTPNVSTTATAENLEPGMYNVMVMEAGATCQLEFNIEITEAPLPNGPNVQITFPLCVNPENNTATISPNDERVYQVFAGDNLLGSTPLEGVAAGDYLVVYEDENGCQTELPITVELPDEITVEVAATPASCENNDGTITLTPTGGIGSADDFTYEWFPNVSNSNVATNLAIGTYDVIVRDSVGCSKVIKDIEIADDCPCIIGLQIADKNDVTCAGNDGSIALEVINATNDDYTIQWNNDLGNELTINNLSGGTYQATVTDNVRGCTANITVVINGMESITQPELSLTQIACAGGNDGMILSADGRTYAIYNVVTNEFQADPTSLTAGTYRVVYTSIDGCSAELEVSLTQPEALSISATNLNAVSCEGNDGAIQLNVTGGEPDYVYQWDDSNLSGNFAQNLAVGIYTLTVTDGNGCQIVESYEISEDCECNLSINVLSNKMASCDEENGSIDIEVVGTNYGELSYNWTGSNANGSSASSLAAGIYTIEVMDATSGCSAFAEIEVEMQDAPATPQVSVRDISCGDNANAEIVALDDRVYDVYQDDEFIGTTPQSNLGAGVYEIIARNNSDCISQITTEIEPITAMESVVAAYPAGCDGNNGTVRLQILGGVEPYTFEWSDNVSTTKTAEGLTPGQYNVVVTDARGCQVSMAAMVGRVCNIPVDTVRISIVAAVATEYCIPERFLQPTGVLTSGHVLAEGSDETVLATDFTGRCVTFQPAANFSGAATDTISVISCYDSDTEICDKTIFLITVDCPNQFFAANELNVSGLTGVQCLNITPDELADYDVYLNGELQNLSATTCPYNPLATYDYAQMELVGNVAYEVNWSISGQPFSGEANSLFEVADLLNEWDVVDNWSNDIIENRLIGGTAPFNYGTLMITAPNGAPTLLEAERFSSQMGTQIDLGAGVDFITLENTQGCTQTIGLTTEPVLGSFRFADFTASVNVAQTAVPLHWKTLREDNLARFYIEHSVDSMKFKTLDQLVMGKGPGNELNAYDWTHRKPRWGYNYYRIRYVNER
ncbi:MAG: SprB repeat-containing protein, partial [Saprospiraceae bacterium]